MFLPRYVKRGVIWQMILLRSLDIITIVVPPALPAAMTVGTYYAQVFTAHLFSKRKTPKMVFSGETEEAPDLLSFSSADQCLRKVEAGLL